MNMYKKVIALSALLSVACVGALVNDGFFTIGLNGKQNNNAQSNKANITPANTYTFKGFDVSLYCAIAKLLNLVPKFVYYSDTNETDTNTALATALAANEIDCFGGITFILSSLGSIYYYGVATADSTFGIPPTGIAFIAVSGLTQDALSAKCPLMFAVQAALDQLVASAVWVNYLRSNNANVSGAQALVGFNYPPLANQSSINGLIPAQTNANGTITPNCASVSSYTLPTLSCLAQFILSTASCPTASVVALPA
jgi:hypothetical protein